MQRIIYITISTVLLVFCSMYALDQKEAVIQNYTTSEEVIDINNSSQNAVQEEIVIEESETSEVVSSSTTTSIETSEESTIQEYATPSASGKFKSYTNYKLLNHKSPQWIKVQCNKNAYTDENGLRKVGEYYCAAMGSYYSTTLGDIFEIQTDGGSFKIIICDFKSDKHTDTNNQYTLSNGCMVEFYVDTTLLNKTAKQMGDISYADKNFKGKIVAVNKLGNYFEK